MFIKRDVLLFVIIVPFALRYDNIIIADHINEAVFFIDPSAPFSIWAVFSGSGFPSQVNGSRWMDFKRLFIFSNVFLSWDCQ